MVGFVDTHDNMKNFDQKFSGKDPGPYVGTVKFTDDPIRQGRLGVNIPELSLTNNPTINDCIWCQYLSPFYGAKSVEANTRSDPDSYKGTQHSYGMWFVPPDIDTQVLVIFAKGEQSVKKAFWIGCVQEPLTNHQVPGYGSSSDTIRSKQDARELAKSGQTNYGTDFLPVGEKNRKMLGEAQTEEFANSLQYPINDILADQLMTQGLVADPIKGTTSSSARRESPSQVFGINTPGRVLPDSRKKNIGPEGAEVRPDRAPGHSFVMDDGALDGTNQLTRLRTASGHQLLMHDTAGVVYIANGSGTAYIEMTSAGINLYSGIGGINMRTHGDFNLHSDTNINLHAGQSIRMSASGTDEVKYNEKDIAVQKGQKTTSDIKSPKIPGQIIQSTDLHMTMGDQGVFVSSQSGGIQSYAQSSISSFVAEGPQLHGAKGQIHIAGQQVHMNSTKASSLWGPTWLTKDRTGMQVRDEGDVNLAGKGERPLKPFTTKTKTTVHKLVTHEPMPSFQGISGDGIIPDTPADKEEWLKRAKKPGTPEFLSNQLRLSENKALREAQAQADKLQYLKKAMGASTDGAKAKKLLSDFTLNYNELYGITEMVDLKFDIKDSISEQFKAFDVNSDVKDLANSLTSQVIDNFTGVSKDLFKDNVFVNSAGELFTLGKDTFEGIGGGFDLANSSLNAVKGLKGNLSAGNIPATISNLSSITQNYKSVIGGKIVGIDQIQGLATKAGLFNASAAQLGGQTFLQNVGQNIGLKLGSLGKSIKSAFSGFKGFSDARLKEDIKLVGKSPSGINIYSFKYKHTDGTYEGVMAQEVPWAREMTDTGYYVVDYGKVDVEFRRLH